jgi:hypothetical protein
MYLNVNVTFELDKNYTSSLKHFSFRQLCVQFDHMSLVLAQFSQSVYHTVYMC